MSGLMGASNKVPIGPQQGGLLSGVLGLQPAIPLVCLLVWTLANMDQALFGFIIPGVLLEFGLPITAIGTILTISFLIGAALVIVAGTAADRFGRAAILAGLLATSALLVGMQGFASGIVVLTALRALGFGVSSGLAPITNVMVAENSYTRYRGLAMGLLQCGYPLGWFLGSLTASPLLAAYGWRSICFVAFAVVPLCLPILLVLKRASLRSGSLQPPLTKVPAPGGAVRVAALFTSRFRRSSLACAMVFFLFGGAYAGSAFFFPTFFTQQRGYTAAHAARLVGLSNGIAVFGYMGAAFVGEYLLTRRNVFIIWCLGGAASLAGLLWLSHSPNADLVWYGVTAALFFGSQAVFVVMVSELFPKEIRTTALAVCGSAPCYLGFAIFPALTTHIIGALGWKAGLSAAILPPLVGAGLVALFLPNRRSGLDMEERYVNFDLPTGVR
jgi:putative MFS transporter